MRQPLRDNSSPLSLGYSEIYRDPDASLTARPKASGQELDPDIEVETRRLPWSEEFNDLCLSMIANAFKDLTRPDTERVSGTIKSLATEALEWLKGGACLPMERGLVSIFEAWDWQQPKVDAKAQALYDARPPLRRYRPPVPRKDARPPASRRRRRLLANPGTQPA